MTLWNKGVDVAEDTIAFSAGDEYLIDQRLVPYDCRGSIAHVKMLLSIGVVNATECEQLIAGLEEIARLHRAGEFTILRQQEDCHTAIEEWLTERCGDAGKKIHLGRSRNDQVLTAMRLYEKDAIADTRDLLVSYQATLRRRAEEQRGTSMPGYTHMRKAMPTTVGTWLAAFADSVADDQLLLGSVATLTDRSPLGTGAGYGIPVFDVCREKTAAELGFAAVQENPIHTHMSRGKYEAAILAVLSQIMLSLNRLATDLLLFSTDEFGFVSLPHECCTGSSIMPHKKNPDVLELVRAKYHVVVAEEFKVSSLAGNLPTGYQRDLGLTKQPVFEAFDSTTASLKAMTRVVESLHINEDVCRAAMTEELYATEEAYRLVKSGMPFRDAYRKIGEKYVDR
jgi:argininosuccinate lyase